MVAGDLHSFPEVEPVRFVSLYPGLELEGPAALLPGHVGEPVEHPLAVSPRTSIFGDHEVVHVEELPVSQKLDEPESRHAPHLLAACRSGEPVARALHAPYRLQILVLGQVRAQLPHHGEGRQDLGIRRGLLDHEPPLFSRTLTLRAWFSKPSRRARRLTWGPRAARASEV